MSLLLLRLFLIGVWCLSQLNARAMVSASSQTNTNPPSDGCPWSNVGQVNGAGGIYLGAGWVLTADHVGPGNFIANGALFSYDGTSHRLTNSDGTVTDMILFHLATLPALSRLTLASNSPAVSAQVAMVGYGLTAASAQTNIGSYLGFYLSAAGSKSWGNNTVNVTGQIINAGYGNLMTFTTPFTNPGTGGSTNNEGQAAMGDSGGAVFQQNGSTWQLAGMVDAISTQPGQPANTAVYGQTTYAGTVATYSAQMRAWMAATVPTLSITRLGTNVLISWPDTGVAYTLQSLSAVPGTNWSSLGSNFSASNGLMRASVPITGNQCFFRLKH